MQIMHYSGAFQNSVANYVQFVSWSNGPGDVIATGTVTIPSTFTIDQILGSTTPARSASRATYIHVPAGDYLSGTLTMNYSALSLDRIWLSSLGDLTISDGLGTILLTFQGDSVSNLSGTATVQLSPAALIYLKTHSIYSIVISGQSYGNVGSVPDANTGLCTGVFGAISLSLTPAYQPTWNLIAPTAGVPVTAFSPDLFNPVAGTYSINNATGTNISTVWSDPKVKGAGGNYGQPLGAGNGSVRYPLYDPNYVVTIPSPVRPTTYTLIPGSHAPGEYTATNLLAAYDTNVNSLASLTSANNDTPPDIQIQYTGFSITGTHSGTLSINAALQLDTATGSDLSIIQGTAILSWSDGTQSGSIPVTWNSSVGSPTPVTLTNVNVGTLTISFSLGSVSDPAHTVVAYATASIYDILFTPTS